MPLGSLHHLDGEHMVVIHKVEDDDVIVAVLLLLQLGHYRGYLRSADNKMYSATKTTHLVNPRLFMQIF